MKTTRRFLNKSANFLIEEIEDRIVDMLNLDKPSTRSKSTSKVTGEDKTAVHFD